MFNPAQTISQIAHWPMTHPKEVQTILDAAAALDNLVQEAPAWDGVLDPKKVAATVQAQIQHTLSTGDAADDAVRSARYKISNALTNEVAEHLEVYLAQLEKSFNESAEVYEEAVALLPSEFTMEDVIAFDPEQFQAYNRAKGAAAEIQAAKFWLNSLVGLVPGQGFDRSQVSTDFLILDPRSIETWASVQLANTRNHDAAYAAVSPVLMKAIKAGAVLRVALPAEAAEVAAGYEEQRQDMGDQAWRKIRTHLFT